MVVHSLPRGLVVVVADGAGGLAGGAAAADGVAAAVERALTQPRFSPFDAASWVHLFLDLDRSLSRDHLAGETTAVVLALEEDGRIVGASCGDSGALVVDDGNVDDLTGDSFRKARLGSGKAIPRPLERAHLRGLVMAATDGVLAYASSDVIARIVGAHDGLDSIAVALVDAVRLAGGGLRDDAAVAVVRVDRGAPVTGRDWVD